MQAVTSAPIFSTPAAAQPHAAHAVTWADMTAHRAYLVNFARRRLLDPALAEDLVHDVFEAVATGRAEFGGRAAVRSWLVAILKHKIVDLVRQRVGHDSLDAALDDSDEGPAQAQTLALALALTCPQPRPDDVAEQRQLLGRVLQRIGELPATLRDAVELRLLQDQSTADVCRTLAITEQNLFVRLHRARRVLAA